MEFDGEVNGCETIFRGRALAQSPPREDGDVTGVEVVAGRVCIPRALDQALDDGDVSIRIKSTQLLGDSQAQAHHQRSELGVE